MIEKKIKNMIYTGIIIVSMLVAIALCGGAIPTP